MAYWLLGAAFVAVIAALTAGMLIWLRAVDRKLGALLASVQAAQRDCAAATQSAAEAAGEASRALRTVNSYLAAASGLFEAAERVGGAAGEAAQAAQRLTAAVTDSAQRHVRGAGGKYKRQMAEALDWAEIGYTVWQFWQSKRNVSSACSGQGEGHHKTVE
jgi:uncharacterized protein YoxC